MNIYGDMNIDKLMLLGSGTQGSVYKINEEKCIKIFKKKVDCINEVNTLLMAQLDNHFPKLYSYGEKYIIREFIDGITLDSYLRSYPFTPYLANKLIELYEAMYSVGFSRVDTALFHIFLLPNEEIKLIDTSRAMKIKSTYPKLILNGLNKLKYKKQFLSYVKIVRPDIYNKWFNIK